jgi:peptidoglycan/xylan/chitin deacetylase (PgdA/CDA1 family)
MGTKAVLIPLFVLVLIISAIWMAKPAKAQQQQRPAKQVIITFDDDWAGQYKYAMPILQKYGFNATFFVTCQGPLGQSPEFQRGNSNDITTWNQLKDIKSKGFDIENHGMTHHSLVDASYPVLINEIVQSKQCLIDHLGINASVYAPAYSMPLNDQKVNAIIANHYDFARNGYGIATFSSPQYALATDSVNMLDVLFEHNTSEISAAFDRNLSRLAKDEIPVLVYHNIAPLNETESNWHNSTTTPETFEAEMKSLKDNGFQVHSIRDLSYDQQHRTFKMR